MKHITKTVLVDLAILCILVAVVCLYVIVKTWEAYKWCKRNFAIGAFTSLGFSFGASRAPTAKGGRYGKQ